MKDFVERLRQLSIGSNDSHMREIGLKAADYLESHAAEIERLRDALEEMVINFEPHAWGSSENKSDALANARAALSGEPT